MHQWYAIVWEGFLGHVHKASVMNTKKIEAEKPKIPEEYVNLPFKKKRVIGDQGKYAYVKCFYNNGIYWIGENVIANSGNAAGYFTLCLNTSTMPAFWQSNDFQQLKVCIDWMLDNGIDLVADPVGQYIGYCNMIKQFFPDYLHLLCPQWYWREQWEKCKQAELKAYTKYRKIQVNNGPDMEVYDGSIDYYDDYGVD